MPFLSWLDSKAAGAPRWLTRAWGGDFLRASAIALDAAVDSARQGVKMRFPSFAPPDALQLLGEERQTVRATAILYEDDTAYSARLRRLWDDAYWRGTEEGLRRVLAALGISSVSIYSHGEWFPSLTWRTWAYVHTPQPWGPGHTLGDGWVLGDGSTLGSSATVDQVRNVREVTAPWVPPHTIAFLVLKTKDGPVIGDGLWTLGDGKTLGDAGLCAWRLGEETLQ